METAAGVPLAVGKAAIQILNQWLENIETAKAWFGPNWKDFIDARDIQHRFIKTRKTLASDKITIDFVFTIKEADWKLVIRNCLEECHTWHNQRGDGECCWLPIYRSITKRLDKKKVLEPADSSTSSIGTVASLPAAVLESWGLIVMAYANGAHARYIEHNGGYQAIFDANNFVLTIKQQSLNSPAVAHITAREYEQKVMDLPSDQWTNLLIQGISLDPEDPLLRWWTKVRCREFTPPEDILNGDCDDKIRRMIFDYQYQIRLADTLRGSIFKCIDLWKETLEKHEETLDKSFKGQCDMIIKNLQRVKLLLADGTRDQFCEEMTASDTHHYVIEMLETVKRKSGKYPWLKEEVLPHHNIILALVKLFVLARKVPERWSNRNTGHTLLLAGEVELQ